MIMHADDDDLDVNDEQWIIKLKTIIIIFMFFLTSAGQRLLQLKYISRIFLQYNLNAWQLCYGL